MEVSDKDFVKNYFVCLGSIWENWFDGDISRTEREAELDLYRTRMNNIMRGNKEHEAVQRQEKAIEVQWTSKMIEQSGVAITKCPTGVARGLAPSDFIKSSRGSGRISEAIATDDPKYDMYANALPALIRNKVCAAGLDVRQLYKEYRSIGRDAMVAKYGEL